MAQQHTERRKYIRLNSCFPVEFSLYFSEGNPASQQYQGFTCDVSEGGMCLQAKNLKAEDSAMMESKRPRLNLLIQIPIWGKPIEAQAEIAWFKKDEKAGLKNNFHIGLSYINLNEKDKNKIINHARHIKWFPRIVLSALVLMFMGLAVLSTYHFRATGENKSLVRQIVSASEVKSDIERRLNEIKVRKDMLESTLSKGFVVADSLESEIARIEKKSADEKERLDAQLQEALLLQKELESQMTKLSEEKIGPDEMAYKVTRSRLVKLDSDVETLNMELAEVIKKAGLEKDNLQEKLDLLQEENLALKDQLASTSEGEVLLEEQLARLKYETGEIEKASVEKMLEWVKVRQVKRTGLVLSYEGDPALKDYGFIYDQALAAQAFLLMGETQRAKDVLDFFNKRAKMSDGLFYNAYDIKTASPKENVVHSGPNIWVAITACQYIYHTSDKLFLELAEGIASKMIEEQRMSSDGSISGGPDTEWVSTEHNLDAYALFVMLYRLTKKQKYADAASAAFNWLKDSGYNREEARFMRGKGDATIATDTFSWAVAALGPETLAENSMDPDAIMEFAENECRVQVKFYRPEGRAVDITGFDFAKASNVGRGGIVSTEWTAQMVVAFKMMADYHKNKGDLEKGRIYRFKSEYYLAELGKMVVSSPSPTGQGQGCLPYASIDNVDTGHGWRVASGRRTGSVAGTAYYIFAYKGYNPLAFSD
jgi:hypothetical protein